MNTPLRSINHLKILLIVLLVLSAAQFACSLPLRQAKPLARFTRPGNLQRIIKNDRPVEHGLCGRLEAI
jgi:hypothetical protein